MHLKKNDTVLVLAGKDKGKKGRVLSVEPGLGTAIVENIGYVKRHTKPNPQAGVAGGIVEMEAPIQVSNVAIFNPETNKADRVGYKVDGDTKVRVFKSSGKAVDA